MNWIIQWFCRWNRRKKPIVIDGHELPVLNEQQMTALKSMPRGHTIGDYSRDSENLISSDWINGDGPR